MRTLSAACGLARSLSRKRRFVLCLLLLSCVAGCGRSITAPVPDPPSREQRIDASLQKGAQFLLAHQSSDGAWRADTYGAFKDGTALTPLALRALQDLPTSPDINAARARGIAYLVSLIQTNEPELSFPLYTAASAIIVLSHPGNEAHHKARDAWVTYLRQRQLTEDNGWDPADKEFGGWGYCMLRPLKPRPGEFAPALTESNLSATLFAVDALRAAGVPADDPALRKALVFVQHCQNFAEEAARDPKFDDGGFFFIYDDPVRNKAGVAGKDAHGRQRFHSYGSMTADGLRALALCGLPANHPRVRAAQHWLAERFRATSHPGTFVAMHQSRREATYFYYCASLTHGWRLLGATPADGPALLADEVMARQEADGSWVNPVDAVRENDEVTATSFALMALGNCRPLLHPDR